jgi:hypothetical protein
MIISILDNTAGFFSMFFFTMNHYIYSKKNNINFKLDTSNWLFKYKNGWSDYFNLFDLDNNINNDIVHYFKHINIIENYPIYEYKNIINEVYIYNTETINKINKTKILLNLESNMYDSIFIRRGDKLISESIFIHASEYLKILLQKNPSSKKIFLQTDDYNTYLELEDYIKNNNLDIEIITLCDKNLKGYVIFNYYLDKIKSGEVIDYLKDNSTFNLKSVNQMNNEEIYQHTIDMIIGLDIIKYSNICITEYSSNVSRFIKLFHNNPDNVYNILNHSQDIDYNKIICPAYSF